MLNSFKLTHRRCLYWLAAIMLFPTALYSQDPRFRIEQVATQSELPQKIVRWVMQDHYGFMWFGTREGLEKFDGYRFDPYRYNPFDTATLGSQPADAITEDSLGHIWVGANTGALSRMDRRTGRCVRYYNDQRNPICSNNSGITWLGTDRNGTVWIGSDTMLSFFNPRTARLGRISVHIPPAGMITPFIDRTGELWVCVSGNENEVIRKREAPRLGRYDPASGAFRWWTIPYEGGLMQILGQRQNHQLDIAYRRVRSSSQPLLIAFNPATESFRAFDVPRRPKRRAGDVIVPELVDGDGEFWYLVRSEIGGLEVAPSLFCQPVIPMEIASSHTTSVRTEGLAPTPLRNVDGMMFYVDRTQTIWIGTQAGIFRVSRTRAGFRTWRNDSADSSSLPAGLVRSVRVDRAGTLWCGTTGGLSRFDTALRRWHRYHADLSRRGSLPANTVNVMAEDHDGTLLLGTYAGPVAYDRLHDRFYPMISKREWPDQQKEVVWSILRDREKRLWVGTKTGIHLFDSNGHCLQRFRHVDTVPGSIPDDRVWCMHEDRRGTIWIGTNGGLCRWMPSNGTFRSYRNRMGNRDTASGGFIWVIHEDAAGVLWFSTYGEGISRYDRDRDTFRIFTARDRLPSNDVFGILEESVNVLWLSTAVGLVRWDRGDTTFRVFDASDSLQGNLFGFKAYFSSTDGTFYFGGPGGLSEFNPKNLRRNLSAPPVYITAFSVFGKLERGEMFDGDTIRLQYRQNYFSFEFAALDYINSGKNEYEYMLEGVDPGWVHVGSEHRVAGYTNLDPATYTFRVRGTNCDGVWNTRGIAITVIIAPPWWKTHVFQGGAVLLGCCLIVGSVRRRTRSVRRHEREKRGAAVQAALEMQEEERTRIGRDLHDGVGQKMTGAVFNLSALRERIRRGDAVSEHIAHVLDLVIGILVGAAADLRAVSHALGTSTLEMEGLPAAVAEVLRNVDPDCPTRFEFIIKGCERRLPRDLELGLFRVIQELVANVMKHSHAREATIQLLCDGTEARLTVEDDGVGFDPATARGGMGLGNIAERVAMMGGTHSFDSRPGRGTTVIVTVPIRRSK